MISSVSKGIFWIKDLDNYEDSVVVKVEVNASGEVAAAGTLSLNSKKGDNYNHKKTWEQLSKKETNNKPFDYYPRGRVEIKNGKAIIYANPNICGEKLIEWCKDTFGLCEDNGLEIIICKPDYSEHYKCYLDRKECL